MHRFLIIGAAVLALSTGAAFAQTTTSETSATTVTPAPTLAPPPDGTLSTTMTRKSVQSDGTQVNSHETTYRDNNGNADEKTTTIVTPAPQPPPEATTTTRTTTTTE